MKKYQRMGGTAIIGPEVDKESMEIDKAYRLNSQYCEEDLGFLTPQTFIVLLVSSLN